MKRNKQTKELEINKESLLSYHKTLQPHHKTNKHKEKNTSQNQQIQKDRIEVEDLQSILDSKNKTASQIKVKEWVME